MSRRTWFKSLSVAILLFTIVSIGLGLFPGTEYFVAIPGLVATALFWFMADEDLSSEGDSQSTGENSDSEGPNRKVRVKYPYVDEVAENLRSTARKFEDPYQEHFFTLRELQIRRMTKSQEFIADALFKISRSGFNLQFVNLNSRNGTVKTIEKKWKQTVGVTPDRFQLYLQDHSLIEFIPLTPKSHLYMSAFWQV